jgi:hypothetical protein
MKDGRPAKVIPVVVGVVGLPVPSTHESFCIQEMPNWPAALVLKKVLPEARAAAGREPRGRSATGRLPALCRSAGTAS